MFQEAFPILSTPDLLRAVGFYRDLLGATVTYQFPADGEPGYVGLQLGPSQLGIAADAAVAEPHEVTRSPSEGRRFALWVYAEDCDAAVNYLRRHGVPVVAEPTDQPWGERMAEVVDPDGNRVFIASR
jgi:lactoylglutathione lyase